jgi:alkylation response protein AidB-like acyl-CoA dehydrogenase
MAYYMTEERRRIVDNAREFAVNEVRPRAAEIDEKDQFPVDLFIRCGELGLTSINVGQEYGGSGIDLTTFTLGVEEISKECATLGLALIAHAPAAAMALSVQGTEEQKQRWLRPMASGTSIGAYCVTEPTGVADPSMWSCKATQDGDEWVIEGTKVFVSNIGVADFYVVKTVTGEYDAAAGAGETHFVVEKDTPGFRVEKIEDKLGWRGSNTGVLRFDGVRVPALNKLGGFNLATAECPQIYYYEFVACGGVALGMCETAYEKAFQYALKRPTKSGAPYYFVYESMRTRLAAMRADVDALRGYIYDRTSRIDEGEISMGQSLLVKAYAWRVAERVCSQALDLHGAVGVVKGSGVEQLLRDAKVGQIGGGQYDMLLDAAGLALGAEAKSS